LEELADDAHRRHAIEQFHEEAKGELGWGSIKAACGRAFTDMR
jgi:hypothetical protein